MTMLTEKQCGKCKVTKPRADFSLQTASRDGLFPYCKPCQRARDRVYSAVHREERRAYNAKWRAEHPDEVRENNRKWRDANRERVKAYHQKLYEGNGEAMRAAIKAWADAHPEIIRARNAANRALARAHPEVLRACNAARSARAVGVTDGHVTAEELRTLWLHYEQRCAYCGASEELTLDHVMPISRGGSNSIDNCVPACWPCNSSKNDRTYLEWRMGLPRHAPRMRGAPAEARTA